MKLLQGMAVLLMALAQPVFAQDGEVSLPMAEAAEGASPLADSVRDAPLPFDDPAALPAIIKNRTAAAAPAKIKAKKAARSDKKQHAKAGKSTNKQRVSGKAASPKSAKTVQKPASAKATPKPAVTKRTGKKKAR